MRREWAEGISVSDTLDSAIERARRFRRIGRYVVELQVPDSSEIEVRQTTGDQHHFTIYATGALLLDFVVGDPIDAHKESAHD